MKSEYIVNFMDTETTGLKPPPHGDIVQIAITQLLIQYGEDNELVNLIIKPKQYRAYANPGIQIELEAMATHHIRPDMLEGERSSAEVKKEAAGFKCDYWAAHNAEFDRKFFDPEGSEWICTLKLARQLYPNSKRHTLQILRYFLQLEPLMKDHEAYNLPAHDAGFDTLCGAALLAWMLYDSKKHITELFDMSQGRVAAPRFPWGKHQGKLWKEVPMTYLKWVVENSNDLPTVEQAKQEMRSRIKPAGLV